MPTIVQSPAFAQRGIALNESSCVEQVNGLVEVQTRFTIAKSRQQEIDRLFHVDAPPPIDPACIAKSSLLTGRLYMQSRTISSSAGFLTIDASYVGGLQRAGFRGYYLTEDKKQTANGAASNGYLLTLDATNFDLSVFDSRVNRVYIFQYFARDITVEFVEIGNASSTKIPSFNFNDLFVFVKTLTAYGDNASLSHNVDFILNPRPSPGTRASDLDVNRFVIRTQEPATFMTPTVKVAKIRYSL